MDLNTITAITDNGHSRIPVYEFERNNIVSCLYMKDLALLNPEEGIPLRSFLSFYGRQIPKIRSDRTLDYVLTEFKSGKSHMAVVARYNGANSSNEDNIGIATLEDVLEEILQDEIMDEDDVGNKRSSNGFREIIQKGAQQINHQQLKAVYTYLSSTLPEFSSTLLSEDAFKFLVGKSEVIQYDKNNKCDEPLYQRGTLSPYFTLILQGKVEIQSGVEGFRSEGGPFTFLGINALKSDNFVPDFTASVLLSAQILRIKKKPYEDAIRMNPTIAPAKKPALPLAPPKPEPKSFMDSNEFTERRTNIPAKTKVTIALRDMTKKTNNMKEERIGLIDAADVLDAMEEEEGAPEANFAASVNAVNSAFDAVV